MEVCRGAECAHAYTPTCAHTHAHTHIRAHTHTHTHIHTHTTTHTHTLGMCGNTHTDPTLDDYLTGQRLDGQRISFINNHIHQILNIILCIITNRPTSSVPNVAWSVCPLSSALSLNVSEFNKSRQLDLTH